MLLLILPLALPVPSLLCTLVCSPSGGGDHQAPDTGHSIIGIKRSSLSWAVTPGTGEKTPPPPATPSRSGSRLCRLLRFLYKSIKETTGKKIAKAPFSRLCRRAESTEPSPQQDPRRGGKSPGRDPEG